MRAVIFGGGGQVGRALAETAPAEAEVIALRRGECDVCSRQQIDRAMAASVPDLVFNAAAFTSVDDAETAVAQATAVNATAPGYIAEAARAAGARIVHISTDYVFDGTGTRPYRPADPPNPRSVYGRTKLAGEEAVRQADPGALTVRTAWVYSGTGINFVTGMLQRLRARQPLQVVADQVGTPTRAQSLAAALWGLAGAGASGLFHYRDSGTASRHEFALAIQEQARALGLLDGTIPIEPVESAAYPTPALRPTYSVLDASEAWQLIGGPPPDWRDNLGLTLDEIRNYR
jgi:dTDP-4-dehydrorhamnose reductase